MKYFNFKRNKFSTIIKNINLNKFNLRRFYKHSSIIKNINLDKLNLKGIYKLIPIRRFNLIKVFKNFYHSIFIYLKDLKKGFLRISKNFILYFLAFIILALSIYSSIPIFYKFDKKYIQDVLCEGIKIKCEIKGKINYSFFPSPRIKVRDLRIKDIVDNSIDLAKISNTAITISFKNLFQKNKIKFKKIKIDKAIINFNLDNVNYYKKFFQKEALPRPINLKYGKIIFFEKKGDVTSIENLNLIYKINKNSNKIILKGDFLGDKISIILKNTNKENLQRTFEVKLPGLNFFSKGKIFESTGSEKTINGNILIKNLKNRITGFFEYDKGKFLFKKASIRNDFLDGTFIGSISFLPYFNFDLDADLESLNFTKLQAFTIKLDKNKKLFKINKKLNGTLNLSTNNVFSKSSLINSFESELSFINGNILLDKLLLNIKKIGAADLTGAIKSDNKFINLKFESNIFIDNLKRFYSKFGIYNKDKEKKPSNLFVSGNIDLINLILRLNEINADKKMKEEDLLYTESEFNKILFENRYESFNFKNLKEFLKIVIQENN